MCCITLPLPRSGATVLGGPYGRAGSPQGPARPTRTPAVDRPATRAPGPGFHRRTRTRPRSCRRRLASRTGGPPLSRLSCHHPQLAAEDLVALQPARLAGVDDLAHAVALA